MTTINGQHLKITAFKDGLAQALLGDTPVATIARETGWDFNRSRYLTRGYSVEWSEHIGLEDFRREVPTDPDARLGGFRLRRRSQAGSIYALVKGRIRKQLLEKFGTDEERAPYTRQR